MLLDPFDEPAVVVNTDAGKCEASGVNLGTPVAADNCGVASVVNNAPSVLPIGIIVVTWTVSDTSGNSATASQSVTAAGQQSPMIAAPADVTVPTDAGKCEASGVSLGTPVTADNCGVAGVPSPYVTAAQVQAYYQQHQAEFGALPEDASQHQTAWEKTDQAIRLKSAPEHQAEYQESLRRFLEELKAAARITPVPGS